MSNSLTISPIVIFRVVLSAVFFAIVLLPAVFSLVVALAQDGATQTIDPIGGLFRLMPLFLMVFMIFYFFVLRPQEKREREHQALLSSLKAGKWLVTSGGIYGKVHAVDGETVLLEVANGVRVRFDRSAILKEVEAPGSAAATGATSGVIGSKRESSAGKAGKRKAS